MYRVVEGTSGQETQCLQRQWTWRAAGPGNTEKASPAGAEQGTSEQKVGTKQSSQERKGGAPQGTLQGGAHMDGATSGWWS